MKKVLFSLFATLLVSALNAQDVMRMEDDLSATFKLSTVNFVQVDGIRHSDLLGSNPKYTAKLKFGKRRFDLELFESSTGKMVWATYSLLKTGNSYFKKDLEKSANFKEVYSLIKFDGNTKTTYEVTISKGMEYKVYVDYSEKTDGVDAISWIRASGSYW